MDGLGTPQGPLIQELRVGARLTQNDVAPLLGISQPQYSRLENGRDRLSVEQWTSVAPLLALGIYTSDPPPLSEVQYLVCWVPAGRLAHAVYPSIADELALFADCRLACQAAAALDVFGLRGACAIGATPRFIERDLLPHLTGVDERRTHRVPQRSRSVLGAAAESLSFASEAFSRFVGDITRRHGTPSVQDRTTPPSRFEWRQDHFALVEAQGGA